METTEAVKSYTRADVELLGEHPMEGNHTTANRYKVGDQHFLVIRHRVGALQNEVLANAGLGYGESYEPYTQMQVVPVDQHVTPGGWCAIAVLNHEEDEEVGISHMLALINEDEAGAVALLEGVGAVDLTDTPIAAEAQDALLVDPVTDPIIGRRAEALLSPDSLDDEPEGPAPTTDEPGNTEDTPSE